MTQSRRAILAALIAGNVAAWLWALLIFRPYPVLMGTALLAYGFGFRHAVDADHIAAIDNVTRKLMRDGQRPNAVGLFFSLGHSTIVLLAAVAIAATAMVVTRDFAVLARIGADIGTAVSVLVLLAVALMNMAVLATAWRAFRRVGAGEPYVEQGLATALAGGGVLTRLFRPLFGIIRRSWHMYFVGFLFGLGFDTATEVGLLGISASQATQGLPMWAILVFPALFTAGMSLVDTVDGVLMVDAYGWAFVDPVRKLRYNIAITFVSVIVALLIGGTEAFGWVAGRFALTGAFWDGVGALNDNFTTIGLLIIALFALCWGASALIYRLRGDLSPARVTASSSVSRPARR